MPSKRFLQLLLAAAAITAITIGLGVGISERNSSLARSANLSLDQTNVDECEADDDDVTTQRQLVRDDEEEETFIVGTMPGGRRTLRRGQEARRLDSELWGDFFGAELAFSMDMSLSMPAGTAGKSGKAKSGGKSGKGSKKCHGKSGKNSQTIDKKSSKSSKAAGLEYELSSEEPTGVPTMATVNHTFGPTQVPSLSPSFNNAASETSSPVPTRRVIEGVAPIVQSTENPSPFPTLKTYSPTIEGYKYTYPPTVATPAPARPTQSPTEASAETTPPGPTQTGPPAAPTPSPAGIMFLNAPSRQDDVVVNELTNLPTSGSTPTVSTEVTGPPTKPGRYVEPV